MGIIRIACDPLKEEAAINTADPNNIFRLIIVLNLIKKVTKRGRRSESGDSIPNLQVWSIG
jgi:hypothetical protein